jgi:hypothetical protein
MLHGFLSPAECAYLIEKASPYMEVSTVVDNASGKSVPSTVRTSTGLFLDKGEDAVVLAIERRIALATDLPLENGEGMQVRVVVCVCRVFGVSATETITATPSIHPSIQKKHTHLPLSLNPSHNTQQNTDPALRKRGQVRAAPRLFPRLRQLPP